MKEDYLKRINYFGIEKQKRKFSEEADELRDAIVEYETTKKYMDDKMKKIREHIAEEIADNIALLKQFQAYYEISENEIKKWLRFKNKRTSERMKNGYYRKKGE